jgi:acetyl esterase/lipase
VECVVPAVEEVLKTGMIDKDRVGLVGHSWGAYQTSFIVTQTDLFSAGIAGAPLTNMMSMAVSVYWNSGQTNAWIFAQSQGRMDKPFWRDVDNYVRNSPIHGLDNLNTPLLIAFGDKDGAVDWGQGVQMYNAARWAGKDDLVMLVYPGENHSLRKEENMVDYHYRVLEWFGHYLKEKEAPKWITEGKSYLDRKEELEKKKEKSKQPAAKPAKPPTPSPKAKPSAEPKKEEEPKKSGDRKKSTKPTAKSVKN